MRAVAAAEHLVASCWGDEVEGGTVRDERNQVVTAEACQGETRVECSTGNAVKIRNQDGRSPGGRLSAHRVDGAKTKRRFAFLLDMLTPRKAVRG